MTRQKRHLDLHVAVCADSDAGPWRPGLFRSPRWVEMSMPPRREVDVVAPEHDLQADHAEADENEGAQGVDLGPGLHHQGHHEQHRERAGAFQEEAKRLAFHVQ
jgi:hypothetical protein